MPAGDYWMGLTRAFLHAGARRVVATLWPVDDWATAALMEGFYGAGDRPSVLLGRVCEHGRRAMSKRATGVRRIWTTRERGCCAR